MDASKDTEADTLQALRLAYHAMDRAYDTFSDHKRSSGKRVMALDVLGGALVSTKRVLDSMAPKAEGN